MDLQQRLNSAIQTLPRYRRYIQAGLTFFTGIGLSVIAYLVVHNWEQKSLETALQEQRDKLATDIQRQVNGNLELLQAIGAFYS